MTEIPQTYEGIELTVASLPVLAKFFKTFSDYLCTLDVEHDHDALSENLCVGLGKATELTTRLRRTEASLNKVRTLENEMQRVENQLGIALPDRWLRVAVPGEPSLDGALEDEDTEEEAKSKAFAQALTEAYDLFTLQSSVNPLLAFAATEMAPGTTVGQLLQCISESGLFNTLQLQLARDALLTGLKLTDSVVVEAPQQS